MIHEEMLFTQEFKSPWENTQSADNFQAVYCKSQIKKKNTNKTYKQNSNNIIFNILV